MRAYIQNQFSVFTAESIWDSRIIMSIARAFCLWFFMACIIAVGLMQFPQSKLFLDVVDNLISSGAWNLFGIIGMLCCSVSIAIPTWEHPRRVASFFLEVAFATGASTLGVLFIDLIEIYKAYGLVFQNYKVLIMAISLPILYSIVFMLNAFVGLLLVISRNNRFWSALNNMNCFFRYGIAMIWLLATIWPIAGYI